MVRQKIVFNYGSDRVGKSTLCRELEERYGYDATVLHFGPPEHTDRYWHSVYSEPISDTPHPIIICDRGPLEANIYRPINIFDIQEYHEFICKAYDVQINLVDYEEWDSELAIRHLLEITEMYSGASCWWIDSMLEKRKQEHEHYYETFYQNVLTLGVNYELV